MIRLLVVAAALAALSACGSDPMRQVQALLQPAKGESAFNAGIRQYENGQYAESQKSLLSAIDQGLPQDDLVTAHKHLAFIHCVSNRERACREEFRKALVIDPGMQLEPAEAGHPIWGPVFKSVKAGR